MTRKAGHKKGGTGRPRRTDDPRTLTIILPGALKKWLRVHAAVVDRDMGDIVADALDAYKKRLKK